MEVFELLCERHPTLELVFVGDGGERRALERRIRGSGEAVRRCVHLVGPGNGPVHDSGSPHHPSYGDRMESHTAGHILAHPFEAMSAMAGLIWFGVAERCPKLRIVHVEADAGWAPYWVQRMEQHWAFSRDAEHPHLRMAPIEYFRRNFYVAARGDEWTLQAALELLGDERFVFNTDYPHPDGTFPWGMESLEKQPISDESRRRIFWDNAAEAFSIA